MKKLDKLLDFVTICKKEGKSLSTAFEEFAKINGLKKYSVRNLYYYGLKKREEKSGKNRVVAFARKEIKHFDSKEVKNLISQIIRSKQKGISVRKTCMQLAEGDIKKMIRLQNKYRTTLATKSDYVENVKEECGVVNNVVTFVPKNVLSDGDINSLFTGLIKLVKSNAMKQASESLRHEVQFANTCLNDALEEIKELKKRLEFEKAKNSSLTEYLNKQLNNLSCANDEPS